jgi:hypothetical protein
MSLQIEPNCSLICSKNSAIITVIPSARIAIDIQAAGIAFNYVMAQLLGMQIGQGIIEQGGEPFSTELRKNIDVWYFNNFKFVEISTSLISKMLFIKKDKGFCEF